MFSIPLHAGKLGVDSRPASPVNSNHGLRRFFSSLRHFTMTALAELNLIHLFDFYLALMLVISLYRRFSQYRAVGGLVVKVPGRWPRLFDLVRQHGGVFLTWTTFLPALLVLVLLIVQAAASRSLWPTAEVTPSRLIHHPLALPFVLILGSAMLGVDIYGIVAVNAVDQQIMTKYFDEAEYWLRSWTAPVVHFFTLGRINPRQMVRVEVRKALVEASRLINVNLWWITLQTGLRIAYGLSLWLTWAIR
jgi:hypothetical protein